MEQNLLDFNFCVSFQYVRAEGFVFSHVADEGLMNACAGQLLRYRKQLGIDDKVAIYTDIKVSTMSTIFHVRNRMELWIFKEINSMPKYWLFCWSKHWLYPVNAVKIKIHTMAFNKRPDNLVFFRRSTALTPSLPTSTFPRRRKPQTSSSRTESSSREAVPDRRHRKPNSNKFLNRFKLVPMTTDFRCSSDRESIRKMFRIWNEQTPSLSDPIFRREDAGKIRSTNIVLKNWWKLFRR